MKMSYIVYGIIVIIVIWKGRTWIRGLVLHLKENGRIKGIKKGMAKSEEKKGEDLVFIPVNAKRTFLFALSIEEIGSGKVEIKVIKNPLID